MRYLGSQKMKQTLKKQAGNTKRHDSEKEHQFTPSSQESNDFEYLLPEERKKETVYYKQEKAFKHVKNMNESCRVSGNENIRINTSHSGSKYMQQSNDHLRLLLHRMTPVKQKSYYCQNNADRNKSYHIQLSEITKYKQIVNNASIEGADCQLELRDTPEEPDRQQGHCQGY